MTRLMVKICLSHALPGSPCYATRRTPRPTLCKERKRLLHSSNFVATAYAWLGNRNRNLLGLLLG
eukprot:5847798-Lingulodinium_polyedra.AAC.1